jgi:hypothetical protein
MPTSIIWAFRISGHAPLGAGFFTSPPSWTDFRDWPLDVTVRKARIEAAVCTRELRGIGHV